ncbi:hypothetical protein BOTBODRAFT_532844 [Botryobasidium botryosum FD-172 SS1]|uniref:Uncharacterized protein n=1 Tax=Botryobasidium botryosum (strain FD-172 SS1) TaxID=930990 RepID=A0A067MCP2_BOTB1|nr:hypothetical protein BOTBODRAFT_532844 [Botryobasidium botryosum FD-172 SS1]
MRGESAREAHQRTLKYPHQASLQRGRMANKMRENKVPVSPSMRLAELKCICFFLYCYTLASPRFVRCSPVWRRLSFVFHPVIAS